MAQQTFGEWLAARVTRGFDDFVRVLEQDADERQGSLDYQELEHEERQLGYQLESITDDWG